MPFAELLGVTVSAIGVSASLGRRPELCTAAGVMHGGVLMALADSLGGICAATV